MVAEKNLDPIFRILYEYVVHHYNSLIQHVNSRSYCVISYAYDINCIGCTVYLT